MSSQGKGARNERAAKRIWADVYGERWVFGAQMTGYDTADIFDLFDFIAWTGHYLHLVQVRSNGATGINEYRRECESFRQAGAFAPLMVTKYDGEGWRLVGLEDGDHFTLYDEREDDGVNPYAQDKDNLGDGLRRYLSENV